MRSTPRSTRPCTERGRGSHPALSDLRPFRRSTFPNDDMPSSGTSTCAPNQRDFHAASPASPAGRRPHRCAGRTSKRAAGTPPHNPRARLLRGSWHKRDGGGDPLRRADSTTPRAGGRTHPPRRGRSGRRAFGRPSRARPARRPAVAARRSPVRSRRVARSRASRGRAGVAASRAGRPWQGVRWRCFARRSPASTIPQT